MHVMPNPFDGSTRVNIQSSKTENVRMKITDMSGRVCAEYNGVLQEGSNLFSISLTTPQTYVLSVHTSSGIRSLKMENTGRAGANRIAYEGATVDNMPVVQLKSSSSHPFQLGDEMRYQGYASSRVSFEVRKNQNTSEQVSLVFDTHGSACDGVPTLQDYDGNTYNTVQIGNQCWMKENLRTTHYANGESIPLSSETASFDVAYRYVPSGYDDVNYVEETGDVSIYGYLYNWKAVMRNSASSSSNPSGVQGVCPNGWHVPSVAEWEELKTNVEYAFQYDLCLYNGGMHDGKVLASDFGWIDVNWGDSYACCVGENQENNNLSGLSIVPSGAYYNGSDYNYIGSLHGTAFLWSSTDSSAYQSYFYCLSECLRYDLEKDHLQKTYGFSVRCLKDDFQPQVNTIPTVETGTVENITTSSADCGGSVTSDGGAAVSSRGVCWSTIPSPTISGAHTTDGNGTGTFASHITGLTDNTTYYVRAYATNSVGTAYGDEISFTTMAVTTPVVTTQTATNISVSAAMCGGNVVSDGGATVTARGICWSTTPNPSLTDNTTTVGSGTGAFTYNITGLTPNTTYHVRAYATNSAGTSYGDEVTFTTLSPNVPTVTTAVTTNITALTASCGGNVTSDGGDAVTARGVCWSTTPNPTVADSSTTDGAGMGAFASSLTGLTPNTTYYVRAYATNNTGTAYGNQFSFTTVKANMPCPGTPTITDYDGNIYNTVQIGNQCWMKENLRTTHYMDGNPIINYDSTNTSSQGYIYRLNALMARDEASNNNPSGVQSVCPVGWHLPSVAEFNELFAFVKSHVGLLCNGDTSHIGWALGGSSSNTCEWTNNATGFTASYSRFRTCSQTTTGFNYVYFDNYGSVQTNAGSNELAGILNAVVRCVRNEGVSVTTLLNDVTTTTASIQCIISNTGTASIISHGVCWSSSASPVINGNNVVYGNATAPGIDNILITGLSFGQHYHVRAFANTDNGVIYGNEILVHLSCHGDTLLMDYDSNVYHSVQIGNQCWMKENLRTLHYSDGTGFYSPSIPQYVAVFGCRYSWNTVMRNSSSNTAVPSGVQGICPDGWHVPSDGEWTALTDYVSSQNQYLCNNSSTNIAKALASELYWNLNYSPYCAAGTILTAPNNATGFSAKPISDLYPSIGNYAQYWSATKKDNDSVWTRRIGYSSATVDRAAVRNGTYSVRCVFDGGWAEVVTDSVSNVSNNSATVYGNVLTDGGNAVTSRGFCWSANPNPTINDQHLSAATGGTGAFSCNLNGLTPGMICHVRAYAINSNGVSYSNDFSFVIPNPNDAQPCTTTPTVSDYDGNVYNTVQIGSQCWLKENLRTTHYNDGEAISLGNTYSSSVAYRYYPNNDSVNLPMYGYLYNWKAVMRTTASSDANPSGVQGICPNGWHVPSLAEFQQLVDYVKSQEQYTCGGYTNRIAKAMADSVGWSAGNSGACSVNYNMSANNATGFSVRGAGQGNGNYFEFNEAAYIWSTTIRNSNGSSSHWHLHMPTYESSPGYVTTTFGVTSYQGLSVRCVKD